MAKQHIEVRNNFNTMNEGRECGECYACCTWLGIEELKKYTGQPCKYLQGTADPTKRCSIYATRPSACSGYYCMWRAGWGADGLRPYDSGILITCYESERTPGKASATVNVFDNNKADPFITDVLGNLIMIPIMDEVRVIYMAEKRAIMLRDGRVYKCRLLPAKGYEALTFETDLNAPIGIYAIQES